MEGPLITLPSCSVVCSLESLCVSWTPAAAKQPLCTHMLPAWFARWSQCLCHHDFCSSKAALDLLVVCSMAVPHRHTAIHPGGPKTKQQAGLGMR